jgi:CheY-like chemotaxis protein
MTPLDGHPVSVVVVDDSPEVRMLTRIALEVAGGFEVVGEAEDGAAGIEMAAAHRPDLIVLDLVMPGVDGLRAIEGLRRGSPESAIVMVSAFDSQPLSNAALDRGADAFISKEASPRELADRLRDALAEATGSAGDDDLPGRRVLLRRVALALDADDGPFAVLHVGVDPPLAAADLARLVADAAGRAAEAPFVAGLEGGELAVLVHSDEAAAVAEAVIEALKDRAVAAVGVASSEHRQYANAEGPLAVAAEMRKAAGAQPGSAWRADDRAPRIADEPR